MSKHKENEQTLKELMSGSRCITGFELNQLVESILNQPGAVDDEIRDVASQLWENYFSEKDSIYKPAKFAYYSLESVNDEYICRRNLTLSPRGTDYFVPGIGSGKGVDYDPEVDTLRSVISNKTSIKGSVLKELVSGTIAREKVEDDQSFTNFSVQLAEYLEQYYLQDGNLKDDIWYIIKTREYGTCVVVRDLERSPRTTRTDAAPRQKNTKKRK